MHVCESPTNAQTKKNPKQNKQTPLTITIKRLIKMISIRTTLLSRSVLPLLHFSLLSSARCYLRCPALDFPVYCSVIGCLGREKRPRELSGESEPVVCDCCVSSGPEISSEPPRSGSTTQIPLFSAGLRYVRRIQYTSEYKNSSWKLVLNIQSDVWINLVKRRETFLLFTLSYNTIIKNVHAQ